MADKSVMLQFPVELVEAIESRAKATGQSMTSIVVQALAEFYGCPQFSPQSNTLKQLQQLQQQLDILERQIAIALAELKSQEFRLTDSEQQILSRLPEYSQQFEEAEQN